MGSTNPKVFFGGDAAFGPKNIIWAVAHGHDAALSIHKLLSGELICPFKHGFLKWLFWDQRINEPTTECFGRALQSVERYGSGSFRFLKLNNPRLGDPQPLRKLN
jgi:hypothetical protein